MSGTTTLRALAALMVVFSYAVMMRCVSLREYLGATFFALFGTWSALVAIYYQSAHDDADDTKEQP